MKNLMLSCFVLLSTNCFSQGLIQGIMGRTHVGIKAGANYSNYVNAGFNTDGLVGYHAGMIIDFRLVGNLSINEEILFSSQGAKVKSDLFGKENVKVNYMTVPLLLKYRTNSWIYIAACPH